MDRTRPALVLIRVLLALLAFIYGGLRLLIEDGNAFFRMVPGDPMMENLPYTTNEVWARFVVVVSVLAMGYIVVRTLWSAFDEYVKQGVETHVAPWSVILCMILGTFAGAYYTLVAVTATVDYRWVWPAFLTAVWATLTIYEVKQHDRYFA
jgi:hypothetical protein